MIVKVNGKEQTISDSSTVSTLLDELGFKSSFVAVAINHDCVPRSQFKQTSINSHDDIEVLAPMSGG